MSDLSRAQLKHQQRIDELCAASIRALTGNADLHFRGQRLHHGPAPLPSFAPHLHPAHDASNTNSGNSLDAFRGAADGLAMRLAHSDATLHAALAPADAVARLVFDLLEQIRAEACAPARWPGLRRNLRQRFEQWSLAYHHSGLNESARGILLYTTAQMCRSRVTGEPLLELTEELIEGTRGMLVRHFGRELYGLPQV